MKKYSNISVLAGCNSDSGALHNSITTLICSNLTAFACLICELLNLPMISIMCDKNGIKLMPALMNMITGMDASALDPAII